MGREWRTVHHRPTGERGAMKFRYAILFVEDVLEAIAFFEAAFGGTRGFVHEGGDYGEMLTGETKLAFSSLALMAQLGKSAGKDAAQAKATYPGLLGLDGAKALLADLAERLPGHLAGFGDRADALKSLAEFVVSRGH